MRLPFFHSQSHDARLVLPLPEVVDVDLLVYFPSDGSLPDIDALVGAARSWVDRHVPPPLGDLVVDYLESGLMTLAVERRDAMPAPPAEYLEGGRFSPEALEALERATHAVLIHAPDAVIAPRAGLWAATAAAHGIASALDGIVFDPVLMNLVPSERLSESLLESMSDGGRLLPVDHILVLFSVDERGAGWMTTKGMEKFGLPNLEVRQAPPGLFDRLVHVMNGLAGRLIHAVMESPVTEGLPRSVALEREMRLGMEDIARAYGVDEMPYEPEDGVRGWTLVGLEYTGRGRRGMEPFIALLPPGGARIDQGEWLYGLLNDLLGPEDPENCDYVPGDNERMEAAHLRAVSELPEVKRRFTAGLKPGEQLYVKHGFPVEDHHEFMWVGVSTWKGTRIHGRLANDPFERMDLRAGQNVEIDEGGVFDWMIEGLGETIEGNYTGRVAREEGLDEG